MSILNYHRPGTKKKLLQGLIVGWVNNHKTRSQYIRSAVLSYPLWIKRNAFKELLEERNRLTSLYGIQYTFDHIIPLNHPYVSGLTVPWNIKLVPWYVNGSKGNKWNPDQMEIDFEIQMSLF